MYIVTSRVALVFVGLAASSLIAGCNSGSDSSNNAKGKASVTCSDGTLVNAKTPAEQESACASHGGNKNVSFFSRSPAGAPAR
jgi:hypothetical protein